jgi:amino acid transporter
MLKRLSEIFLGKSKDPLDASTYHHISLIAFLAWVGLGADGLSSSAYGPEEAFRVLGHGHEHLAFYLACATALTVLVISFSYNQIIELFPHGGGGYTVVSKLLGANWGLVCGSALVVDYILTISISIAAGVDAVFSFLPPNWSASKLSVAYFFVGLLIWLNMRGIKESIKILVPIFLVFVATHLTLILYGLSVHAADMHNILAGTVTETHAMVQDLGWWPLLFLLLKAYSMGGGTYTGIEAVSNGLNQLREPRVRTGKRTMLYMALSLAFTAGGILFLYMLWNVQHVEGKTLNAVLAENVFGTWELAGIPIGKAIIYITLLSEGLLLFVAAQAGFIDGPNVLSNMAADSWMPHRFANLSVRLVRQNGVLLMGCAALATLWYTHGDVSKLVVLYSINVFITFTLSQFSMSMHWWQVKGTDPKWLHRIAINGIGTALTATILVATTIIKFGEGGWVTLLITGVFVGICIAINRHYQNVKLALKRLDDLLIDLPIPESPPEYVAPSPEGPTAVLLVNGYNGLGIHAIFSIRKLFRSQEFKNFIFVSVGQVDSNRFKGVEEIGNLRENVEADLDRYVDMARRMGYYAERRYALGTDRVNELRKICTAIADDFVEPVFFCGKLVFAEENSIVRYLHNQTALEIQRRLMFAGLNTIVVPVRVL